MTNVQAWNKMEDLHRRGLVRSIGVSSFRSEDIEELAKMWTFKPSINQIEVHPYCFHDPRMLKMAETCKKYDIAISPFTSLAPITRFSGGPVDGVVKRIGDAKAISSAQVFLSWANERTGGGPIITTASKEWQYQQILDSIDVELAHAELADIDNAGRKGGIKGKYTLPDWDAL
ncbi:NADP-dependent oxidoreductase domain-containing protein [Dioszegia hungarica]|uniref:NADP-dependent oxidoreductase domain-containing protein n=1 Tax=Dioszegia hungarica TaxID=4972 RepID=A0AA38GZS1_9TREE|nr:NADP-dependent oxidoreductase domain-containing protein [Dioszegia hungarica]KAI9631938.1 NADP-dependent oxidoreductase domain-containing protein [Dioszegia hungarica]